MSAWASSSGCVDRLADDLKQIEQALAQSVLDDERLRKLLTIAGVEGQRL